MDSPSSIKRSIISDDGPPSKKLKPLPEVPGLYSDAVRKKLAATTRTGQACDRCKERKMKCDTDPIACQPCRQKSLRCYTTDRVTGHSRERGQTDRAENEVHFLRDQLARYQSKYGSLNLEDPQPSAYPPHSEFAGPSSNHTPSSRYIGWPAPDDVEPFHTGPVIGTKIDILDGIIDVADFDCPMMQDLPHDRPNAFNLSRLSITNTIFGFQRVGDPRLPPKEETVREANHFLVVMSQYVPIVHRPSFMSVVNRFYDDPTTLKVGEKVQVLVVLAILAQQSATRNHVNSAERFEDSHRYLHYALGFYRELYQDPSLSSMQAMALIIIHFRNLPKPGVSWVYTHKVLVRAIDLEYHRDPDKITLPPGENNPLAKELRKRIFHSILGVCVTTGCRVGRPAPWQFQHVDVPLPKRLTDNEISESGISPNLSGACDFLPCLQLSKLLPLLTELYNNIISVRRPPGEYLKTLDALDTKIVAWRQDWEDSIKNEPKHVNLSVASLLVEGWAAEYQLNLHHPVCCTSPSPEVMERNLDMCHKSAKKLLQNFHILSNRYKGVDFTWHSIAAYAMGFGVTLYIHRRRRGKVTKEQFEAIMNELNGWMSLVAYADLVLRTGNHLQGIFKPRVQRLEDEYRALIIDPPTSNGVAATPTSFLPVNGVIMRPNSKHESNQQSSTQQGLSQTEVEYAPHASVSAQNQYPAAPPPSPGNTTHQWPHPSPGSTHMQYVPHTTLPPGYPSYPAQVVQPQTQFSPIPNSLPPLHNDPNSMYMSYPNPPPPQNQNDIAKPDPAMVFSPNHYFDVNGNMMWPLITMPPTQPQ